MSKMPFPLFPRVPRGWKPLAHDCISNGSVEIVAKLTMRVIIAERNTVVSETIYTITKGKIRTWTRRFGIAIELAESIDAKEVSWIN